MTDGLSCTSRMSLNWQPATLDEAARQSLMREAALLLATINQMEASHELESSGPETRRFERLEAKLDLALHLLVRVLEPGDNAANPMPAGRRVRLTPQEAEWEDEAPPVVGTRLLLELRPSEHLPLSLRLPAIAREPQAGLARVQFENLSAALDDALHQWLFRRQRQAIRSRLVSE